MFEIKNGDIYINRGEKAELTVDIFTEVEGGGKEPYALGKDEKLRLRVLSMPDYKSLLEKFSAEGDKTIAIEGKDTKELNGQMAFSVAVIFPDGNEAFVIAPSETETPRFYVLEG